MIYFEYPLDIHGWKPNPETEPETKPKPELENRGRKTNPNPKPEKSKPADTRTEPDPLPSLVPASFSACRAGRPVDGGAAASVAAQPHVGTP